MTAKTTEDSEARARPGGGGRIASIDALRGLTILAMIFVNDLASVPGAPAWLKHHPDGGDGMTVADWVFPVFLFVVGMSLPFSLGRLIDSGTSTVRVLVRIAARTASLLVVGVFMVNAPSTEGVLPPDAWRLLVYVSVVLAWNAAPRERGARRTATLALRAVATAALVALAFLYRGPGEPAPIELRTQWWGILGLIGWAYLVAALAFLAARRNAVALACVAVALYGLHAVDRLGWFAEVPLRRLIDFGSMFGSHAAVAVSGAAFALALAPGTAIRSRGGCIALALGVGAACALAAFMLHGLRDAHPMFAINKIAATVPWCLWSTAWTLWAWAAISATIEVGGWNRWAALVRPAGENPLFAYLLAPILYALFALLPHLWGGSDFYFVLGENPVAGTIRAALFALGTAWLAGAAARAGLNPRL